MKNSLFAVLLAFALATTFSFALTSCGSQKTEEVAEAAWSCPMHPEVTGKEGDSCNQCGMALEKEESMEEHEQH
ncbi:MAG: heavy metal-binding domain-containing protein [Cyclobacteriaceae bacterium]